MTCSDYQERASALADDRLEAGEIARLQGHLVECDECRRFLNGIYRVRDLIRAEEARSSPPLPSAGFAADLSQAIGREENIVAFPPATPPFRSPHVRWGSLSGAAAAALLLLAVGWSWHRLSLKNEPRMASTQAVRAQGDEGSMASYIRQHALQTMDATYLGLPAGVELASFESSGSGVE